MPVLRHRVPRNEVSLISIVGYPFHAFSAYMKRATFTGALNCFFLLHHNPILVELDFPRRLCLAFDLVTLRLFLF